MLVKVRELLLHDPPESCGQTASGQSLVDGQEEVGDHDPVRGQQDRGWEVFLQVETHPRMTGGQGQQEVADQAEVEVSSAVESQLKILRIKYL